MAHLDPDSLAALLAPLDPAGRAALDHLLTCHRCRASLSASEPDLQPKRTLPPAGRLATRVEASLRREWERELREDHDARQLYPIWAGLPPEERRAATEADSRFHSMGLARLLLRRAQEALEIEPRQSEEIASAVLTIVEALQGKAEESEARHAAAAAWCWTGEARRRGRELVRADEGLATAVDLLGGEPAAGGTRALLCRHLALLRAAQGRLDEALALFSRARDLYEDLGEPLALAATLVELGEYLLDESGAEDALEHLTVAASSLQPEAHPAHALRARLALARCQAELGGHEDAKQTLAPCSDWVTGLPCIHSIRLEWTRARVAALRGDLPEAVGGFTSASNRLLTGGEAVEAAIAQLELARLFVDCELTPELRALGERLGGSETWKASQREVWNLLSFTLSFVASEPRHAWLLERAAEHLAAAAPGELRAFHPREKPSAVWVWAQLPFAKRLEVCEETGVPAALARKDADDIDVEIQDRVAWAYEALTGVYLHFG